MSAAVTTEPTIDLEPIICFAILALKRGDERPLVFASEVLAMASAVKAARRFLDHGQEFFDPYCPHCIGLTEALKPFRAPPTPASQERAAPTSPPASQSSSAVKALP